MKCRLTLALLLTAGFLNATEKYWIAHEAELIVVGTLRLKGMWFLRPIDSQTWKPSVGLGFVDLTARPDYKDYIRRFKR
jgi:hypothetical protein